MHFTEQGPDCATTPSATFVQRSFASDRFLSYTPTPLCARSLNLKWVFAESSSPASPPASLVVWRHFVVNVADERYSHLSRVVAPENVANEVCLDLHVYLLSQLAQSMTHLLGSLAISSEPLSTPTSMFENHNSSCARPSSGSSTKSASGFSSKISENCLLSLDQFVIVGVIFKKILKPTCELCVSPRPHALSKVGPPLRSSPPLHESLSMRGRLI